MPTPPRTADTKVCLQISSFFLYYYDLAGNGTTPTIVMWSTTTTSAANHHHLVWWHHLPLNTSLENELFGLVFKGGDCFHPHHLPLPSKMSRLACFQGW